MPILIPNTAQSKPLNGLKLIQQGKVRDRYELPNKPELMLQVASDRVSTFDVVLPGTISGKGHVLNVLNIWWREEHFPDMESDVIAFGPGIDTYLPSQLRGNKDLHMRATVVEKLTMIDAELIVRDYLTGSALKQYEITAPKHRICGNKISSGLRKWDKFREPIFTPSTKAKEGHDQPMDINEFTESYGQEPVSFSLMLFQRGKEIAHKQGITLIDTKFEMGKQEDLIVLADECLTPDSSRFVETAELQSAIQKGHDPASLDKQYIRDWCEKNLGFTSSSEITPALLQRVNQSVIPESIRNASTELYHKLFYRLTGKHVAQYVRSWY